MGVFARHQQRVATVVCLTDCELYELSASKAKELYYQDPASDMPFFKRSLPD
jgi:hypothetical protein